MGNLSQQLGFRMFIVVMKDLILSGLFENKGSTIFNLEN
jgi:hypothetical protein